VRARVGASGAFSQRGGRMTVGQPVELVDIPPFVKTFEAHPCLLSPSAAGIQLGAVGAVVKVLPVGDVAVRFTSRSLIVAEKLLRPLGDQVIPSS